MVLKTPVVFTKIINLLIQKNISDMSQNSSSNRGSGSSRKKKISRNAGRFKSKREMIAPQPLPSSNYFLSSTNIPLVIRKSVLPASCSH
jgi:hypothetical protein